MSITSPSALPRHDFYQTISELILSLYIKGYGTPELKDRVIVDFQPSQITVTLPPTPAAQPSSSSTSANSNGDAAGSGRIISIGPLNGQVKPEQCTSRVLSSKIEVKLVKATPGSWPSLLSTSTTSSSSTTDRPSIPPSTPPSVPATLSIPSTKDVDGYGAAPGPSNRESAMPPPPNVSGVAVGPSVVKGKAQRKNWDKVIVDEDEDESKDPTFSSSQNALGDDALKQFFANIYSGADEDTKRAMIKSFTESGGTTLSTDWASIGKEKTPIRPPEGMEARKYQ